MAANPSFQKRVREQKMQERREEKARRRADRMAAKKLRAKTIACGGDPNMLIGPEPGEEDDGELQAVSPGNTESVDAP